MPYAIRKPVPSTADAALVAALVRELHNAPVEITPEQPLPDTTSSGAPEIVEEETPRGPIHVTVVWDGWAHLEPQQRGRVILEAYREAFGEERMRAISIAMGLTRADATRLGL